MHNRNLVFFYFRSFLRGREHDAERVQDAKTASKPATKVCKINYAELCGIMQNYAELCGIMHLVVLCGIIHLVVLCGIMQNYAFSGRIMHLHNRLSPDNEDT